MRSRDHHSTSGRAAALVWLVVAALTVPAEATGPSRRPQRYGESPHLAKVSGLLLEARRELRAGRRMVAPGGTLRRMVGEDGAVPVEVRLRRLDAALEAELVAAGLTAARFYPGRARATGRIDLERLEELAAVSEVKLVRERRPPRRRSGTVLSQGDASIRAALARSSFFVDGSGVKVGILSDSLNANLGGTVTGSNCNATLSGTAPQAADELPASVVVLDDCTAGSPECDVLVDEGRALAEIVHDLAPGAEILFHSGFNDADDFAAGIGELRACGAQVILDDLILEEEPMFQDGPIAAAVQAAVDDGAAYLSAAGNEADYGVDEEYLDVSGTDDPTGGNGNDFHDFGGGDSYASVTVKNGCGFTAVLQWNEPYDLSPIDEDDGAWTDLDFILCPSQAGQPALPDLPLCDYPPGGPFGQGCGPLGPTGDPNSDPLEIVEYLNQTGSRQTVFLAVDQYCEHQNSVDPLRFRIVIFADGPGCSLGNAARSTTASCVNSTADYCFESGIFEAPQIYGHATAAGALAVAASFYKEIDTNGINDPPTDRIDVEPFSSQGGELPFYYDAGGMPLDGGAAVTRFKPEITAPDGVNNSFFGADLTSDGDGYPNFVGTSAAVPHAAAVAALLFEAEPTMTGTDVNKLLSCSARDIEDVGRDDVSGYGLVDAVDALAMLSPAISLEKSVQLTANGPDDDNLLDTGDELTYSYRVTNTGTVAVDSLEVTDAHGGAGVLGAIGCPATSLQPGASTTCSATYIVNAGDVGPIANNATATALVCGAAAVASEASDSLTLPLCELDRVLSPGGPVTGTVVEEACRTLDSGPGGYAIQTSADVTYRVGQGAILRDGFSVAANAEFVVLIDPDLDVD